MSCCSNRRSHLTSDGVSHKFQIAYSYKKQSALRIYGVTNISVDNCERKAFGQVIEKQEEDFFAVN